MKFTKYSSVGSWICKKCNSVMPKDVKICWVCKKKKDGDEITKGKGREGKRGKNN